MDSKPTSEAEFTTWFGKKLKDEGGFFHKISDMDIRRKPFDALFALTGTSGAIEFKSVSCVSYCHPYRLLSGSSASKPGSQVKGLKTYQENGGLSLVIVFNKLLQQYRVLNFRGMDFNTKLTFDA